MQSFSFKLYSRYQKAWVKYLFWYFSDPSFRIMCKYSRFDAQRLNELQKKLRLLLCIYPRWGRGHLLLAVLSYYQYQNTRSGEYKGVLRISTDLCRRDPGLQTESILLEILYNFIDRKYEALISIYESSDIEDFARKLKAHEYYLVLETLGSTYLSLDNRSKASDCFMEIPEQYRNSEVRGALVLCA